MSTHIEPYVVLLERVRIHPTGMLYWPAGQCSVQFCSCTGNGTFVVRYLLHNVILKSSLHGYYEVLFPSVSLFMTKGHNVSVLDLLVCT